MKGKHQNGPSFDPHRLANLIEVKPEPGALWGAEELGAILKHQLATAVLPDLSDIGPKSKNLSPLKPRTANLTFSQTLTTSNPPIELLKLIKEFSKVHWNSTKSGIPKEVAMVLYYAAIATAMNHGHTSITKLSRESLNGGFAWVLNQDWIDDAIKVPIRKARNWISD